MRKKASTTVQLVLITSLLASCNKPTASSETAKQKVYMRADSTAPYTEVTQQYHRSGSSAGNALLWYMAFRHLGGGMGYANSGLHPNSVAGKNAAKAAAYKNSTRGGFGKTASSSYRSSGS